MNKHALSAIYCHELRELMIESGSTYRVPEAVAKTVESTKDTRFVKNWAALNQLIPSDGRVGYFEAA